MPNGQDPFPQFPFPRPKRTFEPPPPEFENPREGGDIFPGAQPTPRDPNLPPEDPDLGRGPPRNIPRFPVAVPVPPQAVPAATSVLGEAVAKIWMRLWWVVAAKVLGEAIADAVETYQIRGMDRILREQDECIRDPLRCEEVIEVMKRRQRARRTRGAIEMERRRRVLEAETEGALAPPPPPGRTPALSDIPRFPFPDPAEEPLGDDPLPPTTPPGTPMVPVPVDLPTGDPVTAPAPAPLPAPIPAPVVSPPTLPVPGTKPAPTARPGTPPSPAPTPLPSPSPRPRVVPRGVPAPFLIPFAVPSPSPRFATPTFDPTPITPQLPDPIDLTSFDPTALPFRIPTPTNRCPPCDKEDLDEPRTECFKKLVKEGLFPSQDEVFNWIEIDCLTGSEL